MKTPRGPIDSSMEFNWMKESPKNDDRAHIRNTPQESKTKNDDRALIKNTPQESNSDGVVQCSSQNPGQTEAEMGFKTSEEVVWSWISGEGLEGSKNGGEQEDYAWNEPEAISRDGLKYEEAQNDDYDVAEEVDPSTEEEGKNGFAINTSRIGVLVFSLTLQLRVNKEVMIDIYDRRNSTKAHLDRLEQALKGVKIDDDQVLKEVCLITQELTSKFCHWVNYVTETLRSTRSRKIESRQFLEQTTNLAKAFTGLRDKLQALRQQNGSIVDDEFHSQVLSDVEDLMRDFCYLIFTYQELEGEVDRKRSLSNPTAEEEKAQLPADQIKLSNFLCLLEDGVSTLSYELNELALEADRELKQLLSEIQQVECKEGIDMNKDVSKVSDRVCEVFASVGTAYELAVNELVQQKLDVMKKLAGIRVVRDCHDIEDKPPARSWKNSVISTAVGSMGALRSVFALTLLGAAGFLFRKASKPQGLSSNLDCKKM